jgi:SpoVK/Ycf46/Vps4 family AAA+-type ATPase
MLETTTKKNALVFGIAAYSTAHEHFLDELQWLNRKLAAYVAKMRAANFSQSSDLERFFISDKEIDEFLETESSTVEGEAKNQAHTDELKQKDAAILLRSKIDRRIEASIEKNLFLPLHQLAKHFNLSSFEVQVLLVCIAPIFDAHYSKVYAYLNNDLTKKYPNRELILELLNDDKEQHLSSLFRLHQPAPLIHYGLIEISNDEAQSFSQSSPVRIDYRIAQYVLCEDAMDNQLASLVRTQLPLSWRQVVVSSEIKDSLNNLLDYELSQHGRVCFYFSGRHGVGKRTLARALCGNHGLSVLIVDVRDLLRNSDDFEGVIRRVFREGLLRLSAVCFCNIESLETHTEQDAGTMAIFIEALQELGWISFLCSDRSIPTALLECSLIYPIEIGAPTLDEQVSLWKIHLEQLSIEASSFDLSYLASRFNLTGGQIHHATLRALKLAHIRNPQHTPVTIQDLISSSRIQSQPNLSNLARKITPKYCFDDLVLPEAQLSQLHDIVNQIKHRHTVMGLWGFSRKISLGRGLNALFSGSSGTGKTMAAEIIGYELALDIYKIDLSSVVSKYIGETEKNLNRLFDEAEQSNAILFFDEADALLGKRSEVKDAHDRFANIEIAYLLQKMEEYEGITILSTNLRQNIDDAFVRRIQFIVEFPFPDIVHRKKIWEKTFPTDAPVAEDVDFEFLANRFKFAGGNIRNIAIRSSYYAAEQGGSINMTHVLKATKRELQKAGTLFSEKDFNSNKEMANE